LLGIFTKKSIDKMSNEQIVKFAMNYVNNCVLWKDSMKKSGPRSPVPINKEENNRQTDTLF
jgi:hypothetical protein